jgi:hypothetical protein
MSRKMKCFAKTNSDLLCAMRKLQRENIAVSWVVGVFSFGGRVPVACCVRQS